MKKETIKVAISPLGTPPDNEIWYRTDNGRRIAFSRINFDGVNINDNKNVGDYWVLRLFDKCNYVMRHETNFNHLTEISFPNCAKLDSNLLNYTPKLGRVKIKNDEFASTPTGDAVIRKICDLDHNNKCVRIDKYFMWCLPSVLTNGLLKHITCIKDKQFEKSGITSLTLPKSIDDIGFSAFRKCESLETVNLLGCRFIRNNAFDGCLKMHSVNLSEELKSIGWRSFGRCSFSSIRIPGNIGSIEDEAFYGNDNLHTIIFDKLRGTHVCDIGVGVFNGCPNLKTVIVDSAEDAEIIFKKIPQNNITFDISTFVNVDENGVIVKDI